MNAAVAHHLNISETAIVRIEEWANVLFVVCRKLGARFVSKKVVKVAEPKLVNLQGSEKQIAWAEKIRSDKMQFVELRLADAGIKSKEAIDFLLSQSQAKFWIENRETAPLALGIFAAGETGYSFSKKSFAIRECLTVKEKIDGKWIEKSKNQYESQAIGIRFKRTQLTSETANAIWVQLNIDSGEMEFGTGEEPEESDTTEVNSLSRVLKYANAQGWAAENYAFALIRYSGGNYKVDFVKEVK